MSAQSDNSKRERAYAAGYWLTKEGQRVRPRKMSDHHLVATLQLLQRSGEAQRIETLRGYLFSPGPTGDMACLAFDSEFDNASESDWRDYVPVIFEELEDEAERRHLEWNQIEDETAWALSHDMAMPRKVGCEKARQR